VVTTHLVQFFLDGASASSAPATFSGFTTHPGLFAFTGFTPSDVEIAVVSTPMGGVRRKRKWALKRDGKYYYFEDLRRLEAFKRSEDAIVVPRKTEAEAKSIGYPSIRLAASIGDFDRLRQIEREIDIALADERDDEDFMQFLSMI
jgi:hypothetical protein